MNVKQGDLAITTKSWAGNEGKVCRVLRLLGDSPIEYGGEIWYLGVSGPCWLVEHARPVHSNRGRVVSVGPVPDSWLRPISGIPDTETTDTPVKIEEPA